MIRRVPQFPELSMPVQAPEIVETDNTRVACDGGGGALGHPKVFLDVARTGHAKCPYCGTEYRLKPGAKVHGH